MVVCKELYISLVVDRFSTIPAVFHEKYLDGIEKMCIFVDYI